MITRSRITLLFVILLVIAGLAPALNPAAAQQATSLTIGVIGAEDSPTFRGVALVIDKVNADGGVTLPNGQTLPMAVAAAPATTPDEVNKALQDLKAQNVIAIFGPDDDQLAPQALQTLAFAGVPVFTASTSMDAKVGGFVFRTQANDEIRMSALVTVLKTDVQATRIAVYQGGAAFAPQAGAFVLAMAKQQLSPTTTVLQVEGSTADSSASVAMQSQPDTVAAFGTQDQVIALYQAMVNAGFAGKLVTTYADQREFINRLPANKRGNIYGVTGWSFAWTAPSSQAFLTDYVAVYAEVPTSVAAAAFDGATALVLAVRANGSNPGQILTKMLTTPSFFSVQGEFDPSIGTGDLTQNAMVIMTQSNGAPKVIARFKGTQRLSLNPNDDTVQVQPTQGAVPTQETIATLVPTPQPVFVTATPDGVVITILNDTVNVRGGPGINYQILGRVLKDQQLRVFGRNSDGSWLVINFEGTQAWITADRTLVSVSGDVRSLPAVQAPPTPTLSATATPQPSVLPDIQLVGYQLTPSTLVAGQPFTLTVTVRNGGGTATGGFAIAASFDPGQKYGAGLIDNLNPGEQKILSIGYTGVNPGPGTYTVAIVLDLNKQVNEGDAGEANNLINITYSVQ